jgi:hypothetical protein
MHYYQIKTPLGKLNFWVLSTNKTCCNENSYEKENIYNKRMMKHTWRRWRRVQGNHMSGVRRGVRIMLWVGPRRTVVLG